MSQSTGMRRATSGSQAPSAPTASAIPPRDRTIRVRAGIAITLDAGFNGGVADYDSILEREFGGAFREI